MEARARASACVCVHPGDSHYVVNDAVVEAVHAAGDAEERAEGEGDEVVEGAVLCGERRGREGEGKGGGRAELRGKEPAGAAKRRESEGASEGASEGGRGEGLRRRRALLEEPAVLGEVEREHEPLEEEGIRRDEVGGADPVGRGGEEEEHGRGEDEEELREVGEGGVGG